MIQDTSTHPIACSLVPTQQLGIRSYIGVPIILKNGEVFGNLCALDTEPYFFTARDVRLLETMASFLSYVIELEHVAFYDSVTGLYNRSFLKHYLKTKPDAKTSFAVLFLDLDGFKEVNDKYGHDTGDQLLSEIGRRIISCVRNSDMVIRFAGDEFVVILPDATQLEALNLAKRILNEVMIPIPLKQQEISVTVSIGISTYPEDGKDIESLIHKADIAMYESKRAGKNKMQVYNAEMEVPKLDQVEMLKSIFGNHSEAVYMLNLEGQFVNVNQVCSELTGYGMEELVQRKFQSLIAPEKQEQTVRYLEKSYQGHLQQFETILIDKNGQYVDLKMTVLPVIINNQFQGICGIAQDMRKDKSRVLFEVQNQILEMVVKGDPLPNILESLVHMIEKQSEGLLCSILLYDKKQNGLMLGAAPSLPDDYSQAIHGISIGPSVGSCGTAAYVKEKVMVSDITTDPRWDNYREIALSHDLRSCWSVPILDSRQNLLGTFAMYYRDPRMPSVEEMKLIQKASNLASLVIERKQSEDTMDHMMLHDPLTELRNLKYFRLQLLLSLGEAKKSKSPLSILIIDIDRFKMINQLTDIYTGDAILQHVAKRMTQCLETESHSVYRLGGDEFALILPFTGPNQSIQFAQRILEVMKQPFILNQREWYITMSIGIGCSKECGEGIEYLTNNAYRGLQMAKKHGNGYQVFTSFPDKVGYDQSFLETDLHKAIDNEEFFLVYQPQVDIRNNNTIIGVEALIRWIHPKLGLIPPSTFIPVAEETGIIRSVGNWVFQEACKQIKIWKDNGYPLRTISVNVSPRQFAQVDFVETIQNILVETECDPQWLELEITESMTMDVQRTAIILHTLNDLGIRISIDDFGKGYNSLSYLDQLPVNKLKIDQSFIQNPNKHVFIKTMVSMGQLLGLSVLAEGIETSEHLDFVKGECCNEAQGYYFSKPLLANDVEVLFKKEKHHTKK